MKAINEGFVFLFGIVVDDEDIEPAAPAHGMGRGVAAHRPGQRHPEQQHHQAARGQQQPLLEFQPPPVLPHRPQQEFHRRPRHRLKPSPVENVNDDRNRREQTPRRKKRRRDEPECEDLDRLQQHHITSSSPHASPGIR